MYKNDCKCISNVVATTLILVVVVVSVISFQSWNNSFMDNQKIVVNSEYKKTLSDVRIDSLVDKNLFILNNIKNKNISVKQIRIDGNSCNVENNISYGITKINLENCLDDNKIKDSSKIRITLQTNIGVMSKYFYYSVKNRYVEINNQSSNSYLDDLTHLDSVPRGFHAIRSCIELENIPESSHNSYIIMNDIDCSNTINSGFEPILNFGGYFDGNNYIISNLHINKTGVDNVGLFSNTLNNSEVQLKNIIIIDSTIIGNDCVGGLVGKSLSEISNIYFSGNVIGSSVVGGLVGNSEESSQMYNSIIRDSVFLGTVKGFEAVGGISGNGGAVISKTYSIGNISGNTNIGGLAGVGLANIYNSYSISNVEASMIAAAGLVGVTIDKNISNSYFVGNVTSNMLAAAITVDNDVSVLSSFYDKEASSVFASVTMGGEPSQPSYGLNTSNMKTAQTFIDAGWDENIWDLKDGEYPKLK